MAAGVVVTVDGSPLAWSVQGAELTLPPGEAGLATTRVECRLTAPAALAEPATVVITDGYLADRIGWREITAVGDGVRLAGSELPGGERQPGAAGLPRRSAHRPARRALGDPAGAAGHRGRRVRPDGRGLDRRSLARPARRVVHPAGRAGRPDGGGRGAGGAAGRGARCLARHAARARQDRDRGLPGRSARDAAGRAAGGGDRHRDPHRERPGAGVGDQRVRHAGARGRAERARRAQRAAGRRDRGEAARVGVPGRWAGRVDGRSRRGSWLPSATARTATGTGTGTATGTGDAAVRSGGVGGARRRGRAGPEPDRAAGPARRDRSRPHLVRGRAWCSATGSAWPPR